MCDSATIYRVAQSDVDWVWSVDSRVVVVAAVVAGSCYIVAQVDYMRVLVVLDYRLAPLVVDTAAVVADMNPVVDQNRDRCSVDHKNHHHSRCCGNRPIVLVADIVAAADSRPVARVVVALVEQRASDRRWLGSCREGERGRDREKVMTINVGTRKQMS